MRIRIQSIVKGAALIASFVVFSTAAWAQSLLTITAPCPAPIAYTGQPYSFPITVTGNGSDPLTYSLTGSLPPGVSLNSPGTISGTPTATGTYAFSVTVKDTVDNRTATYSCNIVVRQGLTLTTTACPAPPGLIGVPYSFTVGVTGGQPSYSWEFGSGTSLPSGMTLDSSTGVISGTPGGTGTYNIDVLVNDQLDQFVEYNCSFSVGTFAITAPCPGLTGVIGVPYSFAISVAGNPSYFNGLSWSLGNTILPPGLTLNTQTGVISGIPSAIGTYPVSISVTNPGEVAEVHTYNCNIVITPPPLNITTACPITSIPAALTASGGLGSYTFTIIGFLPANLTLTGNTITGQLTAPPGSYGFTIQATDGQQTVQKACSITVNPPSLQITSGCPALPLPQGSTFSFTFTAIGGQGSYVWSIQPALPAGLTLNSTTGVLSGTPTGPPGTVNFTVQVSSGGTSTSIPCSITIAPPRLVLTSTCPGNGTIGTPYGPFVLTAGGGLGAGTYTYSVQGNLPPGVTFAVDTISGTPTTTGTYVFSFSVVSGQQTATSQGCSVLISPPPLKITGNCPTANLPSGSPVSISFGATGGQAPYSYTFSGPAWLTVNTTGPAPVLSGTPGPNDTGTANIAVTVTDSVKSTASFQCTLTIVSAPLQIVGSCPTNVTSGAPISVPVSATGGVAPYTWVLTGNSGLSLAASQGATNSVTGTVPTSLGNYSFTLTLSDSAKSPSANLTCNLTVQLPRLQIGGTCPAPTLDLPLKLSVPLTATGGQSPYAWKASGPTWIGVSSATGATTSVINPTAPDAAGSFTFSVTLSDSASSTPAVFSCTSSINPPPPPTVVVAGLTLQPSLLQTTTASVQTATAALLPLTGTVQLTFLPNAFGITDNPQVYFDGGSRTASFTIAAGQTSFALPNVQQGTDAGTIHVEIIDLKQGGIAALATPHPFAELVVPREAPVIATTDVSFSNETANGFDVVISGFSTPRDMKSVTLTFTAASGATLNGGTSFTVDITSLFTTYYSSAASQLVGSMFSNLHVPVTTTGDKTAIGSVTVTLANSSGSSAAITKSR